MPLNKENKPNHISVSYRLCMNSSNKRVFEQAKVEYETVLKSGG